MLPSLLEVGVLPMLWHQAQLVGFGGVWWHLDLLNSVLLKIAIFNRKWS